MTQKKYTALPALPFIFKTSGWVYAVVSVNAFEETTLVILNKLDENGTATVYRDNVTLSHILSGVNKGDYTLVSNAPQEEAVNGFYIGEQGLSIGNLKAGKAPLDPLVIRVDTTEAERARGILTELEASVTRVKALLA